MINVLVEDDTDLLVLLCHHAKQDSHAVYSDLSQRPHQQSHETDIFRKEVKIQLGPAICSYILFLHAFLGCNTISRLFGIGKGQALKKFEELRYHAQVFSKADSSKEQIAAAGEKALVCLYKGRPDYDLDSLLYKRFCEKVASSSTHVQPQSLLPKAVAAKCHS